MADIEKVIKAWKCCDTFNRKCSECPYEEGCFHDGFDRVAIADAVALLKEQKETISAKEKAIEEYETVLRPDIDSMWIRYAIKKRERYMESFKHGTANWVIGVIHAHWFSDKEMAESFARITHGTVVEIITAIKK